VRFHDNEKPMLRARGAALILAISLSACSGEDSVGPSSLAVLVLSTRCTATGSDLSCSLTDQLGVNLTADARWSVVGPAIVTAPGQIRSTGRGEITIDVAYAKFSNGTREVARYLVDPPLPPRRLWFLTGLVRESGAVPLGGVEVTIVDGYNAGLGAVTDGRGSYRLDHVLTGEPFTLQAVKAGYQPLTRTYTLGDPGGGAGGVGGGAFLDDLVLVRSSGP
jgi:hypothetical protein